MDELELPRRSDRWAAEGNLGNAWAVVALACALLGAAAVGVVAAATAEVLRPLPDDVGYVVYGAVPAFGALALTFGFVAARRPRRRWVAVVAIVLGALLVTAAAVAGAVLVGAFRSL